MDIAWRHSCSLTKLFLLLGLGGTGVASGMLATAVFAPPPGHTRREARGQVGWGNAQGQWARCARPVHAGLSRKGGRHFIILIGQPTIPAHRLTHGRGTPRRTPLWRAETRFLHFPSSRETGEGMETENTRALPREDGEDYQE